MQKNVILLLGIVVLVSLGPVVADSVGEDFSASRKSTAWNALLHLFRRLQLGAGILVPETVTTVATYGGQSAVLWVEGNIMHHVYVLVVVVGPVGTVTLEGKVVFWVGRIQILNSDTPFDAADGETRRLVVLLFICKDGDASVLVLER